MKWLLVAPCPACNKPIGATVEVLPALLATGDTICPLCGVNLRLGWPQVTQVTGKFELYDAPATPAPLQSSDTEFLRQCGIVMPESDIPPASK